MPEVIIALLKLAGFLCVAALVIMALAQFHRVLDNMGEGHTSDAEDPE